MFLGIDIAKNSFDAALIKDDRKPNHKVFANTTAGHQQLLAWLDSHDAVTVHAALEATGTYGETLAEALFVAGHTVSVVNPAQIKAFAQSQLSRTKTDKADAILIARFCQLCRPPAWAPQPPEVRELQALARRLESLLEMCQMEKNRLQAGGLTQAVTESIQGHLSFLESAIKQTRKQISDHIDQNPSLKEQKELLVSIPGIADTTAAVLLAEIGDVSQFDNAGKVAAFAGLVPRIRQSGTSVRSHCHLSKAGTSRLRRALYFPAMVALRFNPLIQALGKRLTDKGKSKMLIIGAAMRKLLYLVYGVLKSAKPFDPDFSGKLA